MIAIKSTAIQFEIDALMRCFELTQKRAERIMEEPEQVTENGVRANEIRKHMLSAKRRLAELFKETE